MEGRKAYSFENPIYEKIREPMRGVIGAYQDANRFLDTLQEWVLIRTGMVHTSRMLHDLAHQMPVRFDVFVDMLHERHLMAEYPSTAELDEEIEGLDRVFEIALGVLEDIQVALEDFHKITDNAQLRPMCLGVEKLMEENSGDYTRLLNAWQMWGNGVSPSSFDSWVAGM